MASGKGGRTCTNKIGVGPGGDISGTDISCNLYGQAVHGADRPKLSGWPLTCWHDAGDPVNKYTRLVCRKGAHSSFMWSWRCFIASLENTGACSFVHLCNQSFMCSIVIVVKLLDKMCSKFKYDIINLIELVESRSCLWDKTSYSTWEPCWLLCITHEIDHLAGADSDFVAMCVHQTWVVLVTTIQTPAPTQILSVHVCPA